MACLLILASLMGVNAQDASRGECKLVLNRLGNLAFIANKTTYSVNGVSVGEMQNKSTMTLVLFPGEYTVNASVPGTAAKSDEATLTLVDGQTYYLGQKWSQTGSTYDQINLIELEEAKAQKFIAKAKPAKTIVFDEASSAKALDPDKKSNPETVETAEAVEGNNDALKAKNYGLNYRDVAKRELDKKFAIVATEVEEEPISDEEVSPELQKLVTDGDPDRATKLKKVAEEFPNLKYRRSSLYTLMINDETRDFHNVIKDAFGNTVMVEKFNDHNVGPYLINGQGGEKDQTELITAYVNENDLAKRMVAKWFNRSEKGGFNMNLIAERGQYNASDMDVKLAQSSQRGTALLSDAGEELIGNTFVLVNDYKYTNKEEVAAKSGKWVSALGAVTGQEGLADAVNVGAAVAGKGYIIKSTSYLYKLVWNDSIAAVFYGEYWTDDTNLDQSKVDAFKNSKIFSLKLVGSQTALADVQSSIFTDKSDEDLISMATIKSTDKATAKLQRKYPEFQTKTPLTSVEPLAAKIGLKEGVEAKDKYEVLEQVIDKDGKTQYKRKAVITVEKGKIWDNRYMAAEEAAAAGEKEVRDRTEFKGSANGLYPGMLLRQIK